MSLITEYYRTQRIHRLYNKIKIVSIAACETVTQTITELQSRVPCLPIDNFNCDVSALKVYTVNIY